MKAILESGWCKVFKFIIVIFLSFFCKCFCVDELDQSLVEDKNAYIKIYELYNTELSSESLKDIKTLLKVKISKPREIWKQKKFFSVWLKKDECGNYPLIDLGYSTKGIDFRHKHRNEAIAKMKSSILGLSPKEILFMSMLLLDRYQDENNRKMFKETLVSILNDVTYSTTYFHILTELKSWQDEINAYETLFETLTNSCLKNKITNRYDRILPIMKGFATLLLPVIPLLLSLQATKTPCNTQGDTKNTTIQLFNELYAGKVNVTSISNEYVIFALLTAQSCYLTSIAPYFYGAISLTIGGVIFFSDLFLNLHSIVYMWNWFFGVNIEKPSTALVKRIFEKSCYHNKNDDEKKRFRDFMSNLLPDLLKKRVAEKRFFDLVDSVVSKYR
ncbi:MAG: hypothetical protein HEEMFOPI_01420 [Holosporales bacterium]